jgi:hypothetical protein
MLGRVSLNPAVHIDLVGHVLFPLVAMVTGAAADRLGQAGAGRFRYLRSPRRDFMVVAPPGRSATWLLAMVAAAVLRSAPRRRSPRASACGSPPGSRLALRPPC